MLHDHVHNDTHFLGNKYTRWYYSIVEHRRSNCLKDGEYCEDHHVVPESFFKQRSRPGPPGWLDGDPEDPLNKVFLTAREHFICHWLLTKMTDDIALIKMQDALEIMNVDSEHQKRYRTLITSRVFERNRIKVAKNRSERMKGENNPAKRPEEREKMRLLKTGVRRGEFSAEWKANMSASASGENNSMYGKKHSDATKALMRKLATGRKQSEEHKQKKADAVRGSKREKKVCPYCSFACAVNTYPRFHGEKCKMKPK